MSEPITTLKEDDIQAIAVMREQANQGEIGYWQISTRLRTLKISILIL